MISMAYDQGAKRFVSLGGMKPVDFIGFPFRRGVARRHRFRAISFSAVVARLHDATIRNATSIPARLGKET